MGDSVSTSTHVHLIFEWVVVAHKCQIVVCSVVDRTVSV